MIYVKIKTKYFEINDMDFLVLIIMTIFVIVLIGRIKGLW